jgi:hypothetical protein
VPPSAVTSSTSRLLAAGVAARVTGWDVALAVDRYFVTRTKARATTGY